MKKIILSVAAAAVIATGVIAGGVTTQGGNCAGHPVCHCVKTAACNMPGCTCSK